MTVRIADLTITEAVRRDAHLPPRRVPGITEAFAGLAGLSVTRGYTREVQRRFGGPRGCTHLEQLARSLGPVVVQAVTSRRARAVVDGEAARPPERERESVGAGLLSRLGRGRPRRSEAGRRLATGDRSVSRAGRGDVPRGRHRPVTRRRGCATARCDRRRPTAVLAVAVALCVGGCTSSGTAVSSPFAGTRPALEQGPAYEVKVQDISGLGPVLVDGQGIALYLFETDVRGAPSRCYDICAVQWPPALLPARVSRPGGRPRYRARPPGHRTPDRRHHPDHLQRLAPVPLAARTGRLAQATGQALTNAGGRWYVVDPAGNAVITK